MKRKYESEILQICHEDAMEMYEIGAISADRMREFDEMCLASEAPKPEPKAARVKRAAALVD
jgi:DNA-binding transcriptional regulator YiaG